MAKRAGLLDTTTLGKKTKLPTSKPINTKKIDSIAQSIKENAKQELKEKTVRTTIDIPESLHRKLKIEVATKGGTIRDYFLRLLNENLND